MGFRAVVVVKLRSSGHIGVGKSGHRIVRWRPVGKRADFKIALLATVIGKEED